MNFSDLVPLLIIVGSIIVSAVSSINKKKSERASQAPAPTPAPRPQSKPQPMQQQTRPVPPPQQNKPVVQPQRKPIHEHPQPASRPSFPHAGFISQPKDKDKEMQAAINKLKKEVSELQREVDRRKKQSKKPAADKPDNVTYQEQNISPVLDLNDPEEMRKAIIYSEIINRKHF